VAAVKAVVPASTARRFISLLDMCLAPGVRRIARACFDKG